VARRSSDEFAVAVVDIDNLGEVVAFMDRLAEALRLPVRIADKEFMCTMSAGIALAPNDGDTAPELLRHADIALARAKADGGQRMRFFEESMDKALQRRRTVVDDLRLALRREEFEVVYQSQFDLATGEQTGVEALVRWHHPVHGKVAPTHFFSVAEETGLIVPLGEWVLRRACSDAVTWSKHLIVAVNLSPAQFRGADVAETVARVLRETGLPPARLELEITESLLINDTEEVFGKLNRLPQLGVKIVMDDFGTGYSSFSYLARFAFDKIKIDREFVRDMTREPAMQAIVKTIITLGKSLGVTVTAEGVESEEQAAMLRDFGCPQAQGFLYGQPGAPDATGANVTRLKPRPSAFAIGPSPLSLWIAWWFVSVRPSWRYRQAGGGVTEQRHDALVHRRLRPRPHHAAGLRTCPFGRRNRPLLRCRGLGLGGSFDFRLDARRGLFGGNGDLRS
jgi:predicted signal transduction protein with EAL and GGDEF domain